MTNIPRFSCDFRRVASPPWSIFPVYCTCTKWLFLRNTRVFFFSSARWVFLRSGLRSTRGACAYTTALVRAPAGLRGGCFRLSKSRRMASSHGVSFRRARAKQDRGNLMISAQFAPRLLYNTAVLPAPKLATVLCGSHGTIYMSRTPSSSLSDGHGRGCYVCARGCHDDSCRPSKTERAHHLKSGCNCW